MRCSGAEDVCRLAGKIIMDIAYGIDVKSPDDKYITIARDALYAMNVAGNVGTFLVDFIPQCASSAWLHSLI